jgi:hypothetical protein
MSFAPIVLFVFNRPRHTLKTLESLKKNPLAKESDLFVFADGPRSSSDDYEVRQVRQLISNIEGFKTVDVRLRPVNYGLARSVIEGVTEVLSHYGRVIVLEDDLLFSPYFLNFMNQALARYEKTSKIFSVGAYTPRLTPHEGFRGDYFLSYRCCTGGWGTWLNRWEKADWEVKDFDRFINDKRALSLFNRGGEDMGTIFKLQMSGRISSWAIRWDYAHFVNQGYCFRPLTSIVGNTGNDGSGVHCTATSKFDVNIDMRETFGLPSPDELELDVELNNRFATFYDGVDRSGSATIWGSLSSCKGRLRRWASLILK